MSLWRDIKLRTDIMRSHVNISAKGHKKGKGISAKKPEGTMRMKQVSCGHTNLHKRTGVGAQAGERVGKGKKMVRTDHTRKPSANAGFGII